MPRPTLRRATCLATMLQRCQRAWEARRSPERAASINSVESGGLACSPSRACRCVTHTQNTQNCRKSIGCIAVRRERCVAPASAPGERIAPHALRRGLATECVGRFFWQIGTRTHKPPARQCASNESVPFVLLVCSLGRGQRQLCACPSSKTAIFSDDGDDRSQCATRTDDSSTFKAIALTRRASSRRVARITPGACRRTSGCRGWQRLAIALRHTFTFDSASWSRERATGEP